MKLDKDFWNTRYAEQRTGWDVGAPTTPLKEFIDSLDDPSIRILIPGCGNAYEAEYLHKKGFRNVVLIDIAPLALQGFRDRVPDFPEKHLVCGDFFAHKGQYDLILEQTFFCALDPKLRPEYARKMYELLAPNGKLAGVLFCFALTDQGPPFGGDPEEYRRYFERNFHIERMEPCLNSIPPRLGNELWVELIKRERDDVSP